MNNAVSYSYSKLDKLRILREYIFIICGVTVAICAVYVSSHWSAIKAMELATEELKVMVGILQTETGSLKEYNGIAGNVQYIKDNTESLKDLAKRRSDRDKSAVDISKQVLDVKTALGKVKADICTLKEFNRALLNPVVLNNTVTNDSNRTGLSINHGLVNKIDK